MKNNTIKKEVAQKIDLDLKKVYSQWEKSTINDFSEYIYVKERTSKFHMQLLNLFRSKIDFEIPLYNEKIIDFYMGLPAKDKENKKIIFDILDHYFLEFKKINNVSSSGRFGSGKGQGMTILNYYLYIFITVINRIILKKFKITYQVDNPYDTEKQEYYFIKNYKTIFSNSVKFLQKNKEINIKNNNIFFRESIGMRGFQIITNTEILKKYIHGEK